MILKIKLSYSLVTILKINLKIVFTNCNHNSDMGYAIVPIKHNESLVGNNFRL